MITIILGYITGVVITFLFLILLHKLGLIDFDFENNFDKIKGLPGPYEPWVVDYNRRVWSRKMAENRAETSLLFSSVWIFMIPIFLIYFGYIWGEKFYREYIVRLFASKV